MNILRVLKMFNAVGWAGVIFYLIAVVMLLRAVAVRSIDNYWDITVVGMFGGVMITGNLINLAKKGKI